MIFRENENLIYGVSLRFFPETEQFKDTSFFNASFSRTLKELDNFMKNTFCNPAKSTTKVQFDLFVYDSIIEEEDRRKMPTDEYIKTIVTISVNGNIVSSLAKEFDGEFYDKFFKI